jgi:hypothetical protein
MSGVTGRITAGQEVIYSRYPPEKFIGRKWLVDEVEKFCADPDRRHIIIVGEPGSGKSAFIAYLAERWNCPRHFIRVESTGGVTGVSPRAFLISIGAQLYQKYGAQIFDTPDPGRTNVAVGIAKDRATVVGRFINELYTLPFLPVQERDVNVKVALAAGESRVVGEQIGRLVNVAEVLDELDLLNLVLLVPLRRLKEIAPQENVVILIDALDESLVHSGLQIVDVIPQPADAAFPDNLHIVMTSRPGSHLAKFIPQDQLRLDDVKMGYRANNDADVRAYIRAQLSAPPFTGLTDDWKTADLETYLSDLETNSDGNFLYLYHYFKEAVLSVQKGLTHLREVPQPHGLDDIYRVFAVQKIKVSVSLRDWVELYLPLLGALAVIREPIESKLLASFADVDDGYANYVIGELLQFLDTNSEAETNRYQLYHRSFAEYLLDARRNREYPLNEADCHARIVRCYRDRAPSWDSIRWDALTEAYPFHYLPFHLTAAKQSEELLYLLRPNWISAKFLHFGSYASLIADFDLALQTVLNQDPRDYASLCGLLVARQTLQEFMINLPESVLLYWLRLGQADRVLAIVDTMEVGSEQTVRLLNAIINELLVGQRNESRFLVSSTDQVYSLLKRALHLMNTVRGSHYIVKEFETLIHLLQTTAGLSLKQRAELLELAQKFSAKTGEPAVHIVLLGLIVQALAGDPGQRDRANELALQLLQQLPQVSFGADRVLATAYFLPALHRLNPDDLLPTVQSTLKSANDLFASSTFSPSSPLDALITAWAPEKTSHPEEAILVLRALSARCFQQEELKGIGIGSIARTLCGLGKCQEALSLIEQAYTLSGVEGARAVFRAQPELAAADAERTRKWLVDSIEFVKPSFIPDPHHAAFFAGELACALAVAGEWQNALNVLVRFYHENFDKSIQLLQLAGRLLAGDPDQLLYIANRITSLYQGANVRHMADACATAGQALLQVRPGAAEEYIRRAVKLCLGQLPEGTTDELRSLLFTAYLDDRNDERALSTLSLIKDPHHQIFTRWKPVKLLPSSETAVINAYTQALAQMIRSDHNAGQGSVIPTWILPKMVERLAKEQSPITLEFCDLVQTVCADLKGAFEIEAFGAQAVVRARIDRNRGLAQVDDLIEQALADLSSGKTDIHSLGGIYTGLAKLAPLYPEETLARLERLHSGVSAKVPSKFQTDYAFVFASIDPQRAAALVTDQIQGLNAEAAAPSGDLLRFIRMVTEFTGGTPTGLRFDQTHEIRVISQTIFRIGSSDPQAAPGLLQELLEKISAIDDPNDRASSLQILYDHPDQVSPELRRLLRPLLLEKVLALAEALPAFALTYYVMKSAFQFFCGWNDFAAAEQITACLPDESLRGEFANNIEVAKRWTQLSPLSLLEMTYLDFDSENEEAHISRSIFLRKNSILLCRDNQAEETLSYLLQNHVAKKDSSRARQLRAFHLCAVPAWYVGGTALLAGIVEKIETFDEYFKASADLIGRKMG